MAPCAAALRAANASIGELLSRGDDNVDESSYIDNSVKYESPTYRGLQVEALYGFSNAAGGFSDNRAYGFGVNYEVNVHYALTPAVTLAGAYTFTQGSFSAATGSGDPKWHQVTLLADYALSKRTDLYAEGVYQHAYGAAGSAFGGALINGLAQSSAGNQAAATVGMRTRF